MNKMKKRALISVYYKNGIEDVGKKLVDNGWEIISTGGTAEYLKKNEIPVTPVSDLTSFPEILDGRVKTLHPAIFAPILSKKTPDHLRQLQKHGLFKFDLVIVNFYPFEESLENINNDHEIMIEKIDIGGPSMVRAAAKNYKDTVVIVDQSDYITVVEKVISEGGLDISTRKSLSAKVFSYTSFYDSLIAGYLTGNDHLSGKFLNIFGRKLMNLRYGENPHQKSSLYISDHKSPFSRFEQLNGKELSYNNILDLSMVYEVLNEFKDENKSFTVIVKHQNPCGAALRVDQTDSFDKAFSGDPISAFGGIVGFNKYLDKETALKVKKIFFEVIIAPDYSERALNILKKKKNLRIIKVELGFREQYDVKTVPGGIIVQERDNFQSDPGDFQILTGKKPSKMKMEDIEFGWKLIKFVKSNGIIIIKDKKLIGVGAGQMSRIDSVELAIKKSKFPLNDSILISDAFFPFKDSIETASNNGISIVVEPGGSIRDEEVIHEANLKGITLIFTGKRHFRH